MVFFLCCNCGWKKIATYDKILAELEADNFSVSKLFTNSGSDSDD